MEDPMYATRVMAADYLFASMWLLVDGVPQQIVKVKWHPQTEIWFECGAKLCIEPTDSVLVIDEAPGRRPVPLRLAS